MKVTFDRVYRGCLLFFVCLVLWSLWASAQPAANVNTNAPGAATLETQGASLDKDVFVTFGLNRIAFLRETKIAGFPLWQYLASLIYIFLAFYVSKFLDYLTRIYLKRWAERTETKLDDLLLAVLNGPIKVISFVVLLYVGLQVFPWPPWAEGILKNLLTIAVAVSLTYMVMRLVDALSEHWMQKLFKEQDKSFRDQLLPILRQSLRAFIVVVAVLLTAQNLGLQITALIGSLGVVGLALSLASKDTVENFFGAVAVFVDKPFKVGDRIRLDNVDGTVEIIGLRSTRVRNQDGFLITIPNKTMGNATITNVTLRPNVKTVMNIGIAYDTPAAKVKEALHILEDAYRQHSMTADVWISFNQFADSSLNIQVVHWWKSADNKAYLDGMQEMNLAIKERFDAAGISFAFPSRTIYLRQETDWQSTLASANDENRLPLKDANSPN